MLVRKRAEIKPLTYGGNRANFAHTHRYTHRDTQTHTHTILTNTHTHTILTNKHRHTHKGQPRI